MEVARLAELPVALQRRIVRNAAQRLGVAPDFEGTETLRNLGLTGKAGQKCELAGLLGERTHRELRLTGVGRRWPAEGDSTPVYSVQFPGEIEVPEWGIRIRVSVADPTGAEALTDVAAVAASTKSRPVPNPACLRPWKPGDRVRLRHSSGPRKVKEVLERMHVTGSARANWPVLERDGRIVWMQGVELEPEPGIGISVSPLQEPPLDQPGRGRIRAVE
jgi:tRNA(Ile)-lysidine synthase